MIVALGDAPLLKAMLAHIAMKVERTGPAPDGDWGGFWLLLINCYQAGSAVDMFDLRDDATARAKWIDLLHDQEVAALTLIDYVVENKDALVAAAIESSTRAEADGA